MTDASWRLPQAHTELVPTVGRHPDTVLQTLVMARERHAMGHQREEKDTATKVMEETSGEEHLTMVTKVWEATGTAVVVVVGATSHMAMIDMEVEGVTARQVALDSTTTGLASTDTPVDWLFGPDHVGHVTVGHH
jgi:hypothetical protein